MFDDAVSGPTRTQELAVVVVAGGRGRRLGGDELGDKAALVIDGEPLLTTVLRRVTDALSNPKSAERNGPSGAPLGDGAADRVDAPPRIRIVLGPVVVVGPDELVRLVPDALLDQTTVVQEKPPGSGPLAAVAAGVGALKSEQHRTVAVIGGDMRDIGIALEPLHNAVLNSTSDAAVLIDRAERVQHLGAVWRTSQLRERLSRFDSLAGRRLADLYDDAALVAVPDIADWSRDIDSPTDLPG